MKVNIKIVMIMPKLFVYSVNQAKKQEPVQVLHVLLVIQDGIEIVYLLRRLNVSFCFK